MEEGEEYFEWPTLHELHRFCQDPEEVSTVLYVP